MRALFIFSLLLGTLGLTQDQSLEISEQVTLIKTVLPNTRTVGVMIGPNDLETYRAGFSTAQNQTGVSVVTLALKEVTRQIPQYIKAATKMVSKHNVDALIIVIGQDVVTSSPVATKITALELNKQGVPVFTKAENALKLGCLGHFSFENGSWVLDISSVTSDNFSVTIPGDSPTIRVK